MDRQVQAENEAQQAALDQRELQAETEIKAQLAKSDPLEMKAKLAHREILVNPDPLVCKENLVPKAHATTAHHHVLHQVIKPKHGVAPTFHLDHPLQSLLFIYLIYFNSNP